MAIKRELIQFTIVNSTDCSFNLPLFQQNVYSVNATTKYSWDVTTANLSCGTGTIVVNSVTYNLTYTPTLAGLLSALNALGFGFFCSETISGSTYIYVVDDTNVYGLLDLCPSGTTTTTTSTTSTTTTAPPTTTTTTTTTSSTTTTTTSVPTTSTTTTTTTDAPTTTTTSTTTSTTTDAPTTTTTSTTTTTTTDAPTTTTTTTTTTTEPPTTTTTTSTTTTTTTLVTCNNYNIEGAPSIDVQWLECDGTTNSATVTTAILVCAQTGSVTQTGGAGNITQLGSCTTPTTSTTTTTTTAATTTTSTTTTTTTVGFETFTLAFSAIDGATACSNYPTINTTQYYAVAGSLLQTGTIIYTDTALTTPAPNGFYSNGVNYWNTGAGAGNLQNQTSCSPTTTTTTSTTTTTTTEPPTTTTTSTTTTTTTLFQNLFFDATANIGGYTITAIDVNSVTPTLTSGTNVPFNTDSHGYNTNQIGTNETLNITVGSYILNGCITVVDSASNTFQQNITGNGNYAFAGLTINNTTTVNVVLADNSC